MRVRLPQSLRSVPRLAAVLGAMLAASCGRGYPGPHAPSTGSSSTPISITGTERIRWDQAADSAAQLAGYRYIGYVDDVPLDLPDASCGTKATNGTFPCSARLPKMSPGPHRLEIAVEEIEGLRRRGLKSGTLQINVLPAKAPSE